MSEIASTHPDSASEDTGLVSSLTKLLPSVNLSGTSSNKWNVINAELAGAFRLPVTKVKTYYISEQKQFHVRLTQPGVSNDLPIVGLLLIGDTTPIARYVAPAGRHVRPPGNFDILILAKVSADKTISAEQIVAREDASLLSDASRLFPGAEVTSLPSAGKAEAPLLYQPEDASAIYTKEDFVAETGIDDERVRQWIETLRRKGQMIFQGPPGTGKTFVASKLAQLIAVTSGGITETVVFHSSYGYADFVAGLAPQLDEEGRLTYSKVPGKLLEFCSRARDRAPGSTSVLFVDEINRADLSSVFGELMYCLEYRNHPVTLAHGPGDGTFSMPSNVLLIGTMNTADRSVASFDHALRRRFAFVKLEPDYVLLSERLRSAGLKPEPLVDVLREVNELIKDSNYNVGTSFFISAGAELPSLLRDIWEVEVFPYLEELFKGRTSALTPFSPKAVNERCLKVWEAQRENEPE